jgi:hypothetical protein
MSHHPPIITTPTDPADQTRAALTELCKAHDHVLEALYLIPDGDLALQSRAALIKRSIRNLIAETSHGTIEP